MVGARVRRWQVPYAQARGRCRRRACALLSVARSALGYQSRHVAKAAPILQAMQTFAGQYPRAGYRTMMIVLARQDHALIADLAYRLWRQAGLQVPRRRPLNCLSVIDEGTRECLAIDVVGNIRSGLVIEVLGRLVSVHGAPPYLRAVHGPEFVSQAVLRWLLTAQIETAFIDPGKPWQNGVDESFSEKFRHEHLSLEWFRNRAEATVSIEQ